MQSRARGPGRRGLRRLSGQKAARGTTRRRGRSVAGSFVRGSVTSAHPDRARSADRAVRERYYACFPVLTSCSALQHVLPDPNGDLTQLFILRSVRKRLVHPPLTPLPDI